MNLHTIDMDRAEARKLYIEYRDAVRARHDEEMAQIMRGYRAVARGHQVIDIVATVKAGGSTTIRRHGNPIVVPRLAVMRADAEWCYVSPRSDGSLRFDAVERPAHNATRHVVHFPPDTIDRIRHVTWWRPRSMVPPVPPRFRPKADIGNFHVLWEAEWQPVPPTDPALLRHIGGDLYAVLATWDLTELERTVLARRFRR